MQYCTTVDYNTVCIARWEKPWYSTVDGSLKITTHRILFVWTSAYALTYAILFHDPRSRTTNNASTHRNRKRNVESTKYYIIFTSYVWKVKNTSKITDLLCCETQPPQWRFPTRRYWLQAQNEISWQHFVIHCSPSPKVSPHRIKCHQTTEPSLFWKMGFSDPTPASAALQVALAVL